MSTKTGTNISKSFFISRSIYLSISVSIYLSIYLSIFTSNYIYLNIHLNLTPLQQNNLLHHLFSQIPTFSVKHPLPNIYPSQLSRKLSYHIDISQHFPMNFEDGIENYDLFNSDDLSHLSIRPSIHPSIKTYLPTHLPTHGQLHKLAGQPNPKLPHPRR